MRSVSCAALLCEVRKDCLFMARTLQSESSSHHLVNVEASESCLKSYGFSLKTVVWAFVLLPLNEMWLFSEDSP
jgi:hypothetical protein